LLHQVCVVFNYFCRITYSPPLGSLTAFIEEAAKTPKAEKESEAISLPEEGVKGKSTFYVKHIIDKELDIEGSNELEEYVEALGYPTRDTIFGGSDRDILACVLEFEESEIVINMMRNIGFPSRNMIYALLKKRNLSKCLAYSNIKVRNLAFSKLFYEGTLH
jgi:hypothetical protein